MSEYNVNGDSNESIENGEELKRRYGEVMDSIAEDIHQINLDVDDDGLAERPVFGDTVSGNAEGEDFIKSISDLDYDNPDEVLSSVNSSAGTNPLFDDVVFNSEFGSGNLGINTGSNIEMPGTDAGLEDDSLTCDECRDLLYDYVSDITLEDENRVIENHLRNCEMCRLELDDIRDMISVMHTSAVPAPPVDLVAGVHDRLAAIAPEIKAESKELSAIKLRAVVENAKNVFSNLGAKIDYFIKHANWKIVAPAALSAVLVIGVASSGLYQVMKSSDEIYNFSDNVALADAQPTAKPSASGLDDYVDGKSKTSKPATSSSSSKSNPLSTAAPSSSSPKATARPSSSSSGLTNGFGSSSSGRSTIGSSSTGSTNKNTTSSNSASSSNRSTTGSGSTNSSNRSTTSSSNRSTTGSTSSSSSSSAAATPKPYVMPNIILPDITSIMNASSAAESVPEPEVRIPNSFDSSDNWNAESSSANTPAEPLTDSAPEKITGGGGSASAGMSVGGGGGSASASVPAMTPAPTAKPASKPDAAVLPNMTPKPSSGPKPTAAIGNVSDADRSRNENGETELFVQKASEMEDASVVSCVIKDSELFGSIINSSYADCSKLEENGDVVLYLTSDEFIEFSKILNDNDLSYSLMVLGKTDNVKVLLSASDTK